MADHYTYLPQIGLSIALAWTLRSWAVADRLRQIVASVLAAAYVLGLGVHLRVV